MFRPIRGGALPGQARKRGWEVAPDAKPRTIAVFGEVLLTRDRSGQPLSSPRRVHFAREYQVFNAADLRGIPALNPIPEASSPFASIDLADRALERSGARMQFGGDRAAYSWLTDKILLPLKEAFRTPADYYATALHELAHWTGHATRLDRRFGFFGDSEYAREELRAEMASAMLSAHLGIPHDPSGHASYVEGWLKVLDRDEAELFRATADAQHIADALLALAHGRVPAWETMRRPQKAPSSPSRPPKKPWRPARPVERQAMVG